MLYTLNLPIFSIFSFLSVYLCSEFSKITDKLIYKIMSCLCFNNYLTSHKTLRIVRPRTRKESSQLRLQNKKITRILPNTWQKLQPRLKHPIRTPAQTVFAKGNRRDIIEDYIFSSLFNKTYNTNLIKYKKLSSR